MNHLDSTIYVQVDNGPADSVLIRSNSVRMPFNCLKPCDSVELRIGTRSLTKGPVASENAILSSPKARHGDRHSKRLGVSQEVLPDIFCSSRYVRLATILIPHFTQTPGKERPMRNLILVSVCVLRFAVPAFAQTTPIVEVSGGYSFLRDQEIEENFHGWVASVAGNLNSWFGIVGEVGGNYRTIQVFGTDVDLSVHSFMFGPRLSGRQRADVTPFFQFLNALEVGFVSLGEALDLTTPSGRALAGMRAVFAEFERAILRDRVKAGIDQARKDRKPHGRPKTAGKLVSEMKQLRKDGLSKRAIAKAPRGQPHLRHPVATSQEALAALACNFDQWRSDPKYRILAH